MAAFQVFDDREGRRDPRMAKLLFGTLASLAGDLDRRNRAGAGIFFTVNGTDGAGRTKANIQALRAWWTDLDDKAAATRCHPETLALPPSLVVRSGHGLHLYWLAQGPSGCAGDRARQEAHEAELKRIQAALATFGADPAVCEVARVMRVPGFWNRKREPEELVELVASRTITYTPEAIRHAFPEGPVSTPSTHAPRAGTQAPRDQARRAWAYAQGHQTTLRVAIKIACGFDLGEAEAFQILWEAYNPSCRPPWAEADLQRKVQEARRVCPNRGWLLEPGVRPLVTRAERTRTMPPPAPPEADPGGDPTRPCFPPFRLDRDGLWFLQKGKADEDGTEGSVKPLKLSGPFQVLAEARDTHASTWGLRLRWQDPDGVAHEETIPRELALGEGAELARILVRRGLWVASDEARRKNLVAYLASVKVAGRARSVERVGWHGPAFVLPDETFGEVAAGEHAYLALDLEHAFRVRGTVEDWQQAVGVHARGNSRLTFALASAFAAPVLGRLGMESGGFHFFGQSSKGKTTCIEAAGSVWGGPVYRETWRATANGLEAVALSHCDCLLILDEQGQALPKEAGEVAYLLANGMDKVRARKTLEGRPRRRWQTLFLSTGEVTLADKLREEGRTTKAGQDVRMVDIPVNPEGLDQAFESWEGFPSSKALADHLRLATRQHYGAAIRAFLGRLCRLPESEVLVLEQRKAAWARGHLPLGAGLNASTSSPAGGSRPSGSGRPNSRKDRQGDFDSA